MERYQISKGNPSLPALQDIRINRQYSREKKRRKKNKQLPVLVEKYSLRLVTTSY